MIYKFSEFIDHLRSLGIDTQCIKYKRYLVEGLLYIDRCAANKVLAYFRNKRHIINENLVEYIKKSIDDIRRIWSLLKNPEKQTSCYTIAQMSEPTKIVVFRVRFLSEYIRIESDTLNLESNDIEKVCGSIRLIFPEHCTTGETIKVAAH